MMLDGLTRIVSSTYLETRKKKVLRTEVVSCKTGHNIKITCSSSKNNKQKHASVTNYRLSIKRNKFNGQHVHAFYEHHVYSALVWVNL